MRKLGHQSLLRALLPAAQRCIGSWASVDPAKISGSNPATVSNLGRSIGVSVHTWGSFTQGWQRLMLGSMHASL